MRGFAPWFSACALRGQEKGNLTFQRYVIMDAKRQQTGSVKLKVNFVTGLGQDYLIS